MADERRSVGELAIGEFSLQYKSETGQIELGPLLAFGSVRSVDYDAGIEVRERIDGNLFGGRPTPFLSARQPRFRVFLDGYDGCEHTIEFKVFSGDEAVLISHQISSGFGGRQQPPTDVPVSFLWPPQGPRTPVARPRRSETVVVEKIIRARRVEFEE